MVLYSNGALRIHGVHVNVILCPDRSVYTGDLRAPTRPLLLLIYFVRIRIFTVGTMIKYENRIYLMGGSRGEGAGSCMNFYRTKVKRLLFCM